MSSHDGDMGQHGAYSEKPGIDEIESKSDSSTHEAQDFEAVPSESGLAEKSIQVRQRQLLDDPDLKAHERKYVWKLDFTILPMVSIFYFFAYVDRGNAANAKLYGLDKGHDTPSGGVGPGMKSLTPSQWQSVIMIFYVGLILFQIPGCIGYRIFPPSKWAAFGVCCWCVVSMLQDVTYNYAGLMVCRVFIGVFEGLYGTGVMYYLSMWYKRTELGMRTYWFLGANAIAGAFGGLIAYGVGHIKSSVPQWKWLFLIEALPAFCLGLFALWRLPDRPMKNNTFKGKDQQLAEARYRSEAYDRAGPIQKKHVIWAFTDFKLYLQVLVYLPTACLISSISGFLPTVISELGYKKATSANLMTIPPYMAAFVLMFFVSYSSDHFRDRGIHITVLAAISAISYLVMAVLPDDALRARYALTCINTASVYATYPPSHAWAANNLGNETKRALGMGLYTGLGNLGSIAGSFFYPTTDGPVYRKGHWLGFAMALLAALFSLANSLILRHMNKSRDRKYGKPDPKVIIDVSEDADNSPHYRFIT